MDLFNNKKIETLNSELNEIKTENKNLTKQVERLSASFSGVSRSISRLVDYRQAQKSLSEITPRHTYSNDQNDGGVYHFDTYKKLVEETVAKRILSIKPQYAMMEAPIIADVNENGERELDTNFTRDVKRIMESSRGISSSSPSFFNGNFGGFEQITEADSVSYGRYGGIYLAFDDVKDNNPTAYKTDASKGGVKKILGMYPLDEGMLTFSSNGLNVEKYDVCIEGQWYNDVHHSRIVRITDKAGLYHVPRVVNIELEIRNAQDIMLSLMSSIAVSMPKVAATVDPNLAGEVVNYGSAEETPQQAMKTLLDDINNMLLNVVEYGHNVLMSVGTTIPEFIQPKLIETASQWLNIIQSISAKTGIPTRLLMGSEVGQLASTQDSDNFNNAVKQYRNKHTRAILRDVVSKLINSNAVSRPLNSKTLEFDIFWPEDKTEIIKTNLPHVSTIDNLLRSGNLVDDVKTDLSKLLDTLLKEML
jgi:hypothetical protein